MITMREFTKNDWTGMAGAERFKGGAEPLIGEMKIDSGLADATVVFDANGLSIEVYQPAVEESGFYLFSFSIEDLALAGRALALLESEMTMEQLRALPGVSEESHDEIIG